MKYVCRAPGALSRRIISRDHKVISQCLTREYSFVFKRARGCFVWDVDGRKYLDFSAGVAVANIGHTNPFVMKAIESQSREAIHSAFGDFYSELPVEFVELLLSFVPSSLNNAFLSNSGTESVEAAYKLARWHSNKKWVLAFEGSFHGRTMGSLSLTKSKPVHRNRYAPFLPVKHVPFPYAYRMNMDPEDCSKYCLDKIETEIKRLDAGAIFVEAIQGEGGYVVPPKNFHKELRKICTERGVLLCDDEVQAGCFRTGDFLAMKGFGVTPDIVSLSKAIGGGIPLGATLANKNLNDWPSGAHANTFGGNLLACAAGRETLKFMRKNKVGENAKKMGKLMLKSLNEMKEKHEIIGDVRGRGLMIGVEIVKNKKSRKYGIDERHQILCRSSEKGLLLLPAGESVIRMCPPLILTKDQAEFGLDVFEDAIKMVK